jgi:predicted permease
VKQDIREAIRFLGANPGFAVVVVMTLGLAIGVNSTIFSVLNGVLLRPLGYAQPDRLVGLWESNTAQGLDRSEVSAATYLDWRQRTHAFEQIGIFRYRGFTLSREGEAERVSSVDVSPAVFRLLGVQALAGRLFTDEEERPVNGRPLILAHGAWMRRFGGDPAVLGTTLRLDDTTHVIVGVMPKDFQFPPTDREVEMWSPLTLDLTALASRPHRMYQAIGRLAAGTTLDQARQDMAAVAATIARENPDTQTGWGVNLVPAHEQVVGRIGETLWILFGAVVLVLVIACANIANLLLAGPPAPRRTSPFDRRSARTGGSCCAAPSWKARC